MNKPVAWMFQGAFDISTYVSFEKPNPDIYPNPTPLYTHPVKYCPSENNEAYEKGFIDGMAKQRDLAVQKFVEVYAHPIKELTDVEISLIAEEFTGSDGLDVVDFGRAILRKAQEK